MKRVSQECKYFKDCPHDWDCLYEIELYGSALMSLELCYSLKKLQDSGLINKPNKYWRRLEYFFNSTFNGEMIE